METKDIESSVSQIIKFDVTTNTHIVTVDGLFAGFSFAGVLQVLNFDKLDNFLLIAVVALILSTILFAIRINIAMRLISCCRSAANLEVLAQNLYYKRLRRIGTKVELAGIISFWMSLIPVTFHFAMWLGMTTIAILFAAFTAYFFIIRAWNKINTNVPQIQQNVSQAQK